jgi:hypothetical protein
MDHHPSLEHSSENNIRIARFEQLAAAWTASGECPAFVAGLCFLWGLWFIDDSILLFRSLSQAVRLLPEVISLLATVGLSH